LGLSQERVTVPRPFCRRFVVDFRAADSCLLGFRAYQAQRAARELKKRDEQAVRDLEAYWGDEKEYVSQARLRIEQFEQAMRRDQATGDTKTDHGWEPLPSGAASPG